MNYLESKVCYFVNKSFLTHMPAMGSEFHNRITREGTKADGILVVLANPSSPLSLNWPERI